MPSSIRMSHHDTIRSLELQQKQGVHDLVKCLAEVHNEHIRLLSCMAVGCQVMGQFNKLGLARQHTSKAMLQVVEDLIFSAWPMI